ncbi:MAG: alpha/beta fold hydrolase [Pirellulales bacterium]|nr:alpha/beta fold hydrolase [Pirellulales bacterium]
MKHLRIADFSMAVVDRGKGATLLLVHGFPLTHAMWQPQIEYFAEHFRVIAPDLPGFGESDAFVGVATMEHMADRLAALLDALEIRDRVIFCGLSMGGYIGWEFWRKHRQRLAGLIQCDTRVIADMPEVAKGRRILAARVLAEGSKVSADAMLPKLFGPQTPQQQAHLLDSVRRMIESNSPAGIAASLEGLAVRRDARELLSQIDLPTLVLVGEYDAISTPDEMRGIVAAIPNAEFVEIPDAGHLSTLENPLAANTAIEKFLTSHL